MFEFVLYAQRVVFYSISRVLQNLLIAIYANNEHFANRIGQNPDNGMRRAYPQG